MGYLTVLSIALIGMPGLVLAARLQANQQAEVIEFAQKAVVRALDYSQGDRQSLIDAQNDFTADGWREFMKWLEGWLDSKGAPLGSSVFMPSGDAVIMDQENGLSHLTVPGTLKQNQNKSATTYRIVVDVRIERNPVKIAHLKPVVQVRPGAAAQSSPPR
jgi:hypothetical protein